MNQQALTSVLSLDEAGLESLRSTPEELGLSLGFTVEEIEALRRADRLVKVPNIGMTMTMPTATITGHNPNQITLPTVTITG